MDTNERESTLFSTLVKCLNSDRVDIIKDNVRQCIEDIGLDYENYEDLDEDEIEDKLEEYDLDIESTRL